MAASGSIKLTMYKWDGRIFYLGPGIGIASAWVRTKPLDFGDASVRKQIQRMILDITDLVDLTNFTLTVSWADNLQETFTEEAPINITGGAEPINLRPRASRYFKLKFMDERVASRWKLSAFEILGMPAGKRM